ncbi:MAG TPA: hypothetical protein VGN63_23605 [Flavisolibacter sp.]|nr:hypothetical protein [Flavisolibacter sp.]
MFFLLPFTFLFIYVLKQKKKEVAPNGYLVAVTASENQQRAVQERVRKIAKESRLLFVKTGNGVSTDLFIISTEEIDKTEVRSRLQSIPGSQNVLVTAFSNPLAVTEGSEVRKLFAAIGLNAGNVPDADLSMYLNNILAGNYSHYLDVGRQPNEQGLCALTIKRLEEHPQFSPDWFKNTSREKGAAHDSDDIEIVTYVMETIQKVEPPPPPPPPPANLGQMTDAQIKTWLQQFDDLDLKDQELEIERTAEEVVIKIKNDPEKRSLIYQLKK